RSCSKNKLEWDDDSKERSSHFSLWSRAPGGDHVVDAGAQILEHEILVGRRLAVVDFLGPVFDRQLDAERLVDRKGDVEEVQAVDAEVVDGVTFRLDGVARNIVTGLGDDGGDGVESRGHRQPLDGSLARARPPMSLPGARPGPVGAAVPV